MTAEDRLRELIDRIFDLSAKDQAELTQRLIETHIAAYDDIRADDDRPVSA